MGLVSGLDQHGHEPYIEQDDADERHDEIVPGRGTNICGLQPGRRCSLGWRHHTEQVSTSSCCSQTGAQHHTLRRVRLLRCPYPAARPRSHKSSCATTRAHLDQDLQSQREWHINAYNKAVAMRRRSVFYLVRVGTRHNPQRRGPQFDGGAWLGGTIRSVCVRSSR